MSGGRFRRAEIVIGWHRVEICVPSKTGKMIRKPFPSRGTMEEEVEAVASRFNSEFTLKVEIKPGENAADFEVFSMGFADIDDIPTR